MVRRSENSFAAKKRRLPYRARISRTEGFVRQDAEAIEAECRRIAGNAEYLHWCQSDRGEREDVRLYAFDTPEKAAAMQAWLDANDIAKRPFPKYGPDKAEIAAMREAALKWGFSTGAVRRVVQAYRRKMFESGEGPPAEYQASHAVWLYKLPFDETMTIGMFLVQWAKEHHPDWFYRRRKVISPPAADTDKAGQE